MKARRARRGSILLEFTLVLPLILALVIFAIDAGRIVLATADLHDAASVAARAGARQGFAGSAPAPGTALCTGRLDSGNPSYDAFCQDVTSSGFIGGYDVKSFEIVSPAGRATGPRWCTRGYDENLFVTIVVGADMDFITPGLRAVLGRDKADSLPLEVTAIARCENAR